MTRVAGRSKLRLSGTNLVRAADHNQRVTLHAIRVSGSLTRVELTKITGLTAQTIGNIMKRLLSDGLVSEAGQLRGGRGQPATEYVIAADACYSVGLNIDRDHVTCVLVDFLGHTLARRSSDVAFALPNDVHELYDMWIEEMLAEARIDRSRLVGLGIAIPDDLALVDLPGRPPEYAEWSSVDLRETFTEPLRIPVFVENDAAAAAMGEMQLGLGQRTPSFFYVLVSRALGGGLVIDGNYFRGAQGRSGEIGFLAAPTPDGDQQIQSMVSLSGLERHMNSRRLELDSIFSGDPLPDDVQSAMLEWIEQASLHLADALVSVNCLINPEAVLIGGRLPAAWVDQLADTLNRELPRRGSNAPAIAPVVRAALAEDAPAVGAAILPFSHFLLPRSTSLWKTSEAPEARRVAG